MTSAAKDDPYAVLSLADLDAADPVRGHVVWDAPRSLWNLAMSAGAIAALFFATWDAVLMFVVLSAVTLCLGHSVGMHRLFVHRSFASPKWLARVLVWLGVVVGMGGPLWTMRFHDIRDWAQRQPDCHWILKHQLPFLLDGLAYLHCRLQLERPPRFAPDPAIAQDPFIRFLDRTWMAQQLPLAVVLFMIGGLPWVLWGVCMRVATSVTMHWAVSYLVHGDGQADWAVDNAAVQARDRPWLAIPSWGEAWHANHHAFPMSARHGLYPGQIDLGWMVIRGLERLGLAWDVRSPDVLPPRAGLTPLTARALSAAAPTQGDLFASQSA